MFRKSPSESLLLYFITNLEHKRIELSRFGRGGKSFKNLKSRIEFFHADLQPALLRGHRPFAVALAHQLAHEHARVLLDRLQCGLGDELVRAGPQRALPGQRVRAVAGRA